MSGDVQPRKRKDKKRKKDELGLEEPRGTSAVLGEGDVFMHSQHDHGTGGHWCAKIIFFSLLAVLVTLIGLIISENRGLTELEANAVESRYSGVLNGWIEEGASDDHHDEHTLDLKNHDENKDESIESDSQEQTDDIDSEENVIQSNEENENDPYGNEENESDIDDRDTDEITETQEKSQEENDEEDEEDQNNYRKYLEESFEQDNEDFENDEENKDEYYNHDDNEYNALDDSENDDANNGEDFEISKETKNFGNDDELSNEYTTRNEYEQYTKYDVSDENELNDDNEDSTRNLYKENSKYGNDISQENDDSDNDSKDSRPEETQEHVIHEIEDHDDNDEDEDDEEVDTGVEIERIEREVSEEEPISTELPALPETNEDEKEKGAGDHHPQEEDDSKVEEDEDDNFTEQDDDFDAPFVEHIAVPAGKPFVEVDEDTSSEKPSHLVPNTLAEEEEYERKQEELRREEEQSSHIWLKLAVGAALLAATHAVARRLLAVPDISQTAESSSKEKTSAIDRRMTLIPEEPSLPATPESEFVPEHTEPIILQDLEKNIDLARKSPSFPIQDSEDVTKNEEEYDEQNIETPVSADTEERDQELYSEDEDEDEQGEDLKQEEQVNEPEEAEYKNNDAVDVEEEMPDDVEIIDDEILEEELEEEEEISDVDDAELLSRLEAKYGRLPEPERPGQKHKDGGNSVEDAWPGEPSDAYWRHQLDKAEEDLRNDWMD